MKLRFALIFLALCQTHDRARSDPFNLHGTYGVFSSNNFPVSYENNLNQSWTVTVSKGFRVAIYFTAFDLEDSYDQEQDLRCASDYVEIFDGPIGSNRSSGRLCGNPIFYPDDAPQVYSSVFRTSGNVATLQFVTDYSNDLPDTETPTGFQVVYKAEDRNECEELEKAYAHAEYPEDVGKCDHHCNDFLGGYSCSCMDGYELSDDGYTCVGKCSRIHISATSGVITSPGYPKNYPKKTDCDWTIETEIGQVISLDFIGTFDIEENPSHSCPYDWLKIDSGDGNKTYCGATAPTEPIVSTGNTVKITFHSDNVMELAGFQISHHTRGIYCPLPTPPEHGRVSETYRAENGRLPYDSVVVFECALGYEMKGVHKIACLKDGTFDDFVPTCVPEDA